MTRLKEDLAKISEDNHGVKGFKNKLLGGVEERLGWFEDDPLYGPSSSVDPRSYFRMTYYDILSRSWSSCIVKEGNRKKARQFLIDEVKKCMVVEGTGAEDPERRTSSSSLPEEEESWERAAKRRKMERQEEVWFKASCSSSFLCDFLSQPLFSAVAFWFCVFCLICFISPSPPAPGEGWSAAGHLCRSSGGQLPLLQHSGV